MAVVSLNGSFCSSLNMDVLHPELNLPHVEVFVEDLEFYLGRSRS